MSTTPLSAHPLTLDAMSHSLTVRSSEALTNTWSVGEVASPHNSPSMCPRMRAYTGEEGGGREGEKRREEGGWGKKERGGRDKDASM